MGTKTQAPPKQVRTFRHHAVRWSLGLVVLLLVTFVVVVVAVFYLIKTVDGQRTLFGAVQSWSNGRVTVIEPVGDIRSNFSAREVQIALPSSRVVVRDLNYSLADYDLRPPRFHFDRLSAAEVDVSTRPTERTPPPQSLELPFALVIDALTIGRLQVSQQTAPHQGAIPHPNPLPQGEGATFSDLSGAIDLGP